MVEKEQARPLAPTTNHSSGGDDDNETTLHLKRIRRRRFIKCCGCISTLLLIPTLTILILMFTVFQVKDPKIQMNSISITNVELINGTIPKPGSNISLTADVSVKNPNMASFKYSNMTTTLYINETVIGEARGPPGQAKAHRTSRMNITMDIVVDQLLSNLDNLSSGKLSLRSFSRIPGRVKLLHIIRRRIVVKMNCTLIVNIMNRSIEDQKCKRKVKL